MLAATIACTHAEPKYNTYWTCARLNLPEQNDAMLSMIDLFYIPNEVTVTFGVYVIQKAIRLRPLRATMFRTKNAVAFPVMSEGEIKRACFEALNQNVSSNISIDHVYDWSFTADSLTTPTDPRRYPVTLGKHRDLFSRKEKMPFKYIDSCKFVRKIENVSDIGIVEDHSVSEHKKEWEEACHYMKCLYEAELTLSKKERKNMVKLIRDYVKEDFAYFCKQGFGRFVQERCDNIKWKKDPQYMRLGALAHTMLNYKEGKDLSKECNVSEFIHAIGEWDRQNKAKQTEEPATTENVDDKEGEDKPKNNVTTLAERINRETNNAPRAYRQSRVRKKAVKKSLYEPKPKDYSDVFAEWNL